jgi:hypothetical protein
LFKKEIDFSSSHTTMKESENGFKKIYFIVKNLISLFDSLFGQSGDATNCHFPPEADQKCFP